MIANTLKSVHEGEFKDNYSTPEYIQVSVHEPITHEESGKKVYTSYKITTVVSAHTHSLYGFSLSCFKPLLTSICVFLS
jgi:hypothetical protein